MTVKTKREKNLDTPEVTSKYYITNGRMLPEVIKSKEIGKISDELSKMLMMLTKKYAQRPCFANYTYKEDMISEALVNLCHNALKFNPEKSSNPFSYYTSCINSSFLQFLNTEKKHRRIRDQLLIEVGENPSFNFQEESKQHHDGIYKEDILELRINIDEAKIRLAQDDVYAAIKAAKIAAIAAALIENTIVNLDDVEIKPELKEELIMNLSLLDFEEIEIDQQKT